MAKRPGFIDVDRLQEQLTVEQVAAFYNVPLPELHRGEQAIRTQCFLLCGKSGKTGVRALAIKADSPVKEWKCHNYECGKSGNLISMCDLLKPGPNSGGRPRGQRFKEIAADLQAMVGGAEAAVESSGQHVPATSQPTGQVTEPKPEKANVPLRKSDNERARGLTELDGKFVVDVASMSSAASKYFRQRRFLTPEVCRQWRIGYLPRDAGGDKSGGTMRGKIVYPILSERDEVLTWFGRDPDFQEKHAQWQVSDRSKREPEKFHFVKNFHRGLELFGQQVSRLTEESRKAIGELGLIVVEGPNDVIALDCLGVPAVGINSNRITTEQIAKVTRWARQLADGVVTLMFDCDPAGELGMRQALYDIAQHCRVRLAWSETMFGGKFRNRQPESLSSEEWNLVRSQLLS